MERAPFGFPSSFAPRRCRRRTSRAGPGRLSTDPELLDHIKLILQSGSSLVSGDRRRTVLLGRATERAAGHLSAAAGCAERTIRRSPAVTTTQSTRRSQPWQSSHATTPMLSSPPSPLHSSGPTACGPLPFWQSARPLAALVTIPLGRLRRGVAVDDCCFADRGRRVLRPQPFAGPRRLRG
jgi:hypothetical protein